MSPNAYIWIPFATWAIAQTLKFGLAAARGRLDFKYLYASGGMPSVHAAVVVALAMTALAREGANSPIFGITAVFAGIVMYDSFGVRRSTGEQAAAINSLVDSLVERVKLEPPASRLREVLGHRPIEVGVGAGLGLVLGAIFNVNYLSEFWAFLAQIPDRRELLIYLIISAVLIGGGVLTKWWQLARQPKSEAWRDLASKILVKTQILGWLGLVAALMQFEQIPVFGARGWSLGLVMMLVAWDMWLAGKYSLELPRRLAEERSVKRKLDWLRPTKRKRRK